MTLTGEIANRMNKLVPVNLAPGKPASLWLSTASHGNFLVSYYANTYVVLCFLCVNVEVCYLESN